MLFRSTGATVEVLSTPRLLAFEVKNRSLLEANMRTFIASRPWRSEFLAANEPREFTAVEVAERKVPSSLLAGPLVAGGAVRVHGLSMTRTPGDSTIHLAVYTEPVAPSPKREFIFFIHQLDDKGNILSARPVPLVTSRLPDRQIGRAHV